MPQQTNLNIAPYFDDFDPTDSYQRVLFKPGYPVQARELTTLQSILQNQIEKFGQNFFKEGAKVIPGNFSYSQLYYAVQLANTFQGVPVEAYVDQLIGTTITGSTSGVTAVVENVLFSADSERGNLTLYVSYAGSSKVDNSTQAFFDGESLTCNQQLNSGLFGSSVIAAGAPFANTIGNNSTAIGSVFQIESGVYFIRGHFVTVNKESLILDQYTNTPNYRVGLFISEEIINSNNDESLNDNSQGFNNFGAPGADRLKISTFLFKKSLDDLNDDNFIELATIEDGNLKTSASKRGDAERGKGSVFFEDLNDVLAKRTFDESGHYVVKPFDVSILNSLNNNLGNRGIYEAGQFTSNGSVPSDNLALCRISPGKAYVKGYEIETVSPTFIDVSKPRFTRTLEDQSFEYSTGPTFKLNSVYRSPTIGVGNTFILSLRDERVGSDAESAPGKEIGFARVFDFKLESGSYNAASPNTNEWGMSCYDIQPFSELTINHPITLSVPSYVEGNSSGATAFVRSPVSAGVAVTVYDKKGEFIKDETLTFRSGISSSSIVENRVVVDVNSYGISNVKSVYSNTGIGAGTNGDNIVGINTFSANVIQSSNIEIGVSLITAESGGVSTVTSASKLFPGNLKENDLLQYSDLATSNDPIVVKVDQVSESQVVVSGVTDVTGVVNGTLPTSNFTTSDLQIITTELDTSSDNTLYTQLPKENIGTIDLTDASATIRKTFSVNIANNQLDTNSLGEVTLPIGETYLSYSDSRYSLIRDDGATEVLTEDKFEFSVNGRELQIRNLGSDGGAQLVTTVSKSKLTSKKKIKNRVKSLIVDKSTNPASGIGTTTLNDGLSYGDYPFGTRVQDKLISINTPDIIEIHGIYETASAVGSNDFGAPEMELSQLNGPSATTGDMLIGELLVGQTSGATAAFAEVKDSTTIRYIPKNNIKFIESEVVLFSESSIQGVASELNTSSYNISSNYTFGTGQKTTTYDHGFLTRKSDSQAPKNKIKIYYKSASFDATDSGDLITVNSYSDFNYSREVKSINGVMNTDIIDLRPRVSEYTVSEGSRSPLEFLGRTFDGTGNSVPTILASNENIFIDYSYYQGRVDRLFLHKDGKFQMKFGTPSDNPSRTKPEAVDNAIEIAEITYPPYLHNVQQASIKFLDHKRVQMKDIKKIETRLRNLEYYTQLSILETNTANEFIPDENGLNRLKSGFFVDNFSSFSTQDLILNRKTSIDQVNQILRPKHYTTSFNLQTGPVIDVDPTEDKRTSAIEGINVRKQNDILSLTYSNVEWINQPYATRTENVTPFIVSFWQGTVVLTPSSDNWVTQNQLEARTVDSFDNYSQIISEIEEKYESDSETGFAPEIWNSWELNWSGAHSYINNDSSYTRTITGNGGPAEWVTQSAVQPVEQDSVNKVKFEGTKSRFNVVENFDSNEYGEKIVSSEIISTVRSRNVEFYSSNLKPSTQLFAFLDGKDVTKYCVPKLIEISMRSGVFQVGEKVEGRIISSGLGEVGKNTDPRIDFRVAQPNHRRGDYDAPDELYSNNPYVDGGVIPEVYSSTSTILNVDTYSLSDQVQVEYFGYVQTGMVLVGKTSGAEAEVTNVRLISDESSSLSGVLFIPDPNNKDNPKFTSGNNVFTLTNDPDNDQDSATTVAESLYPTSGILDTTYDEYVSIRNTKNETKKVFYDQIANTTIDTEIVSSRVAGDPNTTETISGYQDPLSQSFSVDGQKDPEGVMVTRCDIFFRTKDDGDVPIRMQIRPMSSGLPSTKYFDLSEVILYPDQISTSIDGSVATTFEFAAPVYLEPKKDYAICLTSNSNKYTVYISRIGENDTVLDTLVSNQPSLGSLFKPQNASAWEASQYEDLKFTLYRADFVESGSIDLYSPELSEGNKQVATLAENPLNVFSNQIRVGLGTTVADDRYKLGNTFFQAASGATGNLIGVGASAVGTLGVTTTGIGYTPASGNFLFNDVDLITVSGSGSGATADITIENGVAIAATISGNGGNGYKVGDVVTINTIGNNSIGDGAKFTLTSIGHTSQLLLDNVQGEFITGAAGTISFYDSTGTERELNNGTFGGVAFAGDVTIPANGITFVNDGLHIKVNHVNHGMNFDDNFVRIFGVMPDVRPTKLTFAYDKTSTDPIQVEDASIFGTFENSNVGTANTGLLLIGEEIIEYTTSTASAIGGNIVRGITPKTYPVNTPVYKYELGGISLARINKTHDLQDVTVNDPITLDSYHIKLDSGSSNLYIDQNKTVGGSNVKATKNIPFEVIKPSIHNLTVEGTTLAGQIRTVTTQSISGNEIPYVNVGFEDVTLNVNNYLDTPRAIFSKVNEDRKLDLIEGNKSFQMRLLLGSTNSKLSPQIDLQRCSVYTTTNRVNAEVSNYATDYRVNTLFEDPSACSYVSKEMILENPASSLRVTLDAHIHSDCDIRAFYYVDASGDSNSEPVFVPFPGYNNLNSDGNIIDEKNNDGRSDVLVESSKKLGFSPSDSEFKEYVFSIDNLKSFRSYRIKIIMTSTNQVVVPQIKNLRVVALA